jgi:hypothetical protein
MKFFFKYYKKGLELFDLEDTYKKAYCNLNDIKILKSFNEATNNLKFLRYFNKGHKIFNKKIYNKFLL